MTGIVCCITQTRPSSVTCSDLPRITIRPNENQTRASSNEARQVANNKTAYDHVDTPLNKQRAVSRQTNVRGAP
jgi:hypothetical protein